MARTPGSDKAQTWPSTIAYLAQLMIHRYAMLGILTEQGYRSRHAGILAVRRRAGGGAELKTLPGKKCPECGNKALIRRTAANFCTDCGYTGACG